MDLFAYIEHCYNRRRIHSTVGYRNPRQAGRYMAQTSADTGTYLRASRLIQSQKRRLRQSRVSTTPVLRPAACPAKSDTWCETSGLCSRLCSSRALVGAPDIMFECSDARRAAPQIIRICYRTEVSTCYRRRTRRCRFGHLRPFRGVFPGEDRCVRLRRRGTVGPGQPRDRLSDVPAHLENKRCGREGRHKVHADPALISSEDQPPNLILRAFPRTQSACGPTTLALRSSSSPVASTPATGQMLSAIFPEFR